ncbi:uncharacterized protein LOC105648813, partial [Jatropha curcas]|uniref:uncharacterized protein LOC105648813 n=1 Tax=Jatropha curcas TaxID=180498 RepID=UPI001894CF1D
RWQVWDLEQRLLVSTLRWESNITAFSVICGLSYMYVGDEYGMVSVLKYDAEAAKVVLLPYYVPTDSIAEASGMSSPNHHSVVGLLPQPASRGNRLLIAYDDGLIILWDVSEDKVILVKGNKDLQLKSKTLAGFHKGMGNNLSDDISEYERVEKEISSLCWASTDGSVLAVGYVDGDIMLWNLSATASADEKAENLSKDVVRLQLSSAERRLPVIILDWSGKGSSDDCRGQLFIDGGDAIGSEEVLTIISIDWSSGIETIECIGRIDLTLNGSFADMVLLPSDGVSKTKGTLILTNPGQLHFYDGACLASLMSQQQKQNSVSSVQYPVIIPIAEPYMTVGKLGLVNGVGKFSQALFKEIFCCKLQVAHTPRIMDWPLTGGVRSQPLDAENYQVERVYVAGYQDGSVGIWDATLPIFPLVYVLGPEVKGINIDGASASVSTLELCSFTLTLAVGNELGMVHLYKLTGSANETSLHIVKETEKEVHTLHQGDGPQCTAVFSFLNSPICTLLFASFGTRLAVGFQCGTVGIICFFFPLISLVFSYAPTGDRNPIHKVDLLKQCCWTTTFKKDEKECGLILLYQTGVIEIRSLSDLEVVGESSLMSILRWNFKTNMDKTICSSDTAQIMLDLSIDDIDFDEPLVVLPSSEANKKDTKSKGTEKERLSEGASSDSEPRLRTAEEIKAKYRKEDTTAAAAQAKDKLVERQEKLQVEFLVVSFLYSLSPKNIQAAYLFF